MEELWWWVSRCCRLRDSRTGRGDEQQPATGASDNFQHSEVGTTNIKVVSSAHLELRGDEVVVLRRLVRLVESVVCRFRRVFGSGRWAWLPQFRTRTRYNETLRVVRLFLIACLCMFPFCLFVCFKPVVSCSSGSGRWRWATSISPKLNSLWRWAAEWWLKENTHHSRTVTRHYGAL